MLSYPLKTISVDVSEKINPLKSCQHTKNSSFLLSNGFFSNWFLHMYKENRFPWLLSWKIPLHLPCKNFLSKLFDYLYLIFHSGALILLTCYLTCLYVSLWGITDNDKCLAWAIPLLGRSHNLRIHEYAKNMCFQIINYI